MPRRGIARTLDLQLVPSNRRSHEATGQLARRTRLAIWAAGGIGLALGIILVLRSGFSGILDLLDVAGWRLFWLVPLRLIPLALDAAGWHLLLPHSQTRRPGRLYLTWAAVVREAVGGLLPVARVGGEVAGMRLLMRRDVPAAAAGASVVVEVTLWMVAQLVFTATGLILLLGYSSLGTIPGDVVLGLLAGTAAVTGFLTVQRRWGAFGLLERILTAVAGRAVLRTLGNPARLDVTIRALYRHRRTIIACAAWQLASLVAGAIEIWVALRLLGHPGDLRTVFVLESLTLAVQSATFFVPAGLGTQEGSFVLIGGAIGLSPELALAVSLARRMRQIVMGIPALASWFWMERVPLPARPTPAPQEYPVEEPVDVSD